MNRYKKVLGFGDEDILQTTNCKVLWKVPNDFYTVVASIDTGSPVVQQGGSEVGRSYRGLAAKLGGNDRSDLWWASPPPTRDEGPEGADAAGIAVKRPRLPNLNSGAAAASLDDLFG